MTREELDNEIRRNATYICPDEQKRFDDILDALDSVMGLIKGWADGKLEAVNSEVDSDNLAKMGYFALYGIWLELDGLMADWKCRMPKEQKEEEK